MCSGDLPNKFNVLVLSGCDAERSEATFSSAVAMWQIARAFFKAGHDNPAGPETSQ